MNIRESTSLDRDPIRETHHIAFGETEGPIISQLACDILDDDTAFPLLSLVAEIDDQIVGSVIFSSVKIEGSGEGVSAYILAPLAVVEKQQRKGIGRSLINSGLAILQAREAGLVFVLGDLQYYSQAGFEPAIPHHLTPPYQLEYPEAWVVLELSEGSLSKAVGKVKCASTLSSEEHW